MQKCRVLQGTGHKKQNDLEQHEVQQPAELEMKQIAELEASLKSQLRELAKRKQALSGKRPRQRRRRGRGQMPQSWNIVSAFLNKLIIVLLYYFSF